MLDPRGTGKISLIRVENVFGNPFFLVGARWEKGTPRALRARGVPDASLRWLSPHFRKVFEKIRSNIFHWGAVAGVPSLKGVDVVMKPSPS